MLGTISILCLSSPLLSWTPPDSNNPGTRQVCQGSYTRVLQIKPLTTYKAGCQNSAKTNHGTTTQQSPSQLQLAPLNYPSQITIMELYKLQSHRHELNIGVQAPGLRSVRHTVFARQSRHR
ncbi:uncharacterized protein CC84DRAFT_437791 [Paraphaeosphaeria sporulosa]|uniref:Secreted protein n=1 Tax=Paraphaeosphaeria sporulosa TaxID=1460663 RepID=A0A177CRB7_9PLEO|nr:uncharacterized protein CC84DRAFT_437791 [Paraphaeosphaeria sporulosa]OAG09482.1 hypothetical protein CC84DRAFT_437791 [Paraphaeosphaeria sporulosa]